MWTDLGRQAPAPGRIEEGRQAGLVQGKRESLLRVLAAKFGAVSKSITARVETMETAEALDDCLERVMAATSLEETGLED